ncbi:MAG: YceI family protein [Actinobacteria bacterium]|nr:YceI family protein [Actinomycetota bacterium]
MEHRQGALARELRDGAEGVKVTGSVRVDSIDLSDEQQKGHVLSPDFFDAERYPTVDFESTGVRYEDGEAVIDGALTIRGEARPLTVRGKIGEPYENAYGGQGLAVRLGATIDRTQYGLDWQMQLPNGKPVLGNEVTIEVDLELGRG